MSGVRPPLNRADRTPRHWLVLTGALIAIGLTYSASDQNFDTNYYVLWEATALLAGDHPYRDFFEWGVPLQALLATVMQWLTGHRLIGEFATHWIGIVAGGVMAFDIGYRLSRSLAASFALLLCALALLSVTPTFHYPKLLLYPAAIQLTWWYMDRPGAGRSMVLGAFVAVAFLFRHDHGLFIGILTALTMLAARLGVLSQRSLPAIAREAAAGLAVTVAILAPWAALVHANEGLPEYVHHRQRLFTEFSSGARSPFRDLIEHNAAFTLAPERFPAQPGVIAFEWDPSGFDWGFSEPTLEEFARQRIAIEKRLGLRPLDPFALSKRQRYAVADTNDRHLIELDGLIREPEGLDWSRLRGLQLRLPPEHYQLSWMTQVAMLVPLLLILSAGATALGRRRRGQPVGVDPWRRALLGVFLVMVERTLFREPSYIVIVAPLVAAAGTVFLARPPGDAALGRSAWLMTWLTLRTGVAVIMLLTTAWTIYGYTRHAPIYTPLRIADHLREVPAYVISPPIDVVPHDAAIASTAVPIPGEVGLRYVYECTLPGDRLFITGLTPYQVGYLAQRSIAGGHLFWHHRWRTELDAQRQQLSLLQRQAVPFAVSTSDPVFDDLEAYPLVLEYMKRHYVEVPGTAGLLLVDRRRTPTRQWGAHRLPCFR